MRFVSLALATGFAALILSLAAASAQDVGVASCDGFLKTYAACVIAQVPADKKAKVISDMDQLRATWKSDAAKPNGKAEVDATCKKTVETVKKEVAALNCAW